MIALFFLLSLFPVSVNQETAVGPTPTAVSRVRECATISCLIERVKASGLNRSKVTPYYNIGSLSIVQPRELSRSSIRQLIVAHSLKQDKTSLYMDDVLKASIEVSYPKELTPKTERFISQLQKSDMPAFSIRSFDATIQNGSVRLSFILQPQKLGPCIFTPGFLRFDPDGSKVLLPPIEAISQKSSISDLMYVSPLPLYPEQKIDLNLENALKLVSEEALQAQVEENNKAISQYHAAWGFVMAALLILVLSALFFWALVQYELVRRAKFWMQPKKDPMVALLQQAQDSTKTRGERWQALFHLVQQVLEKKEQTPCMHATIEELVLILQKSKQSDEERTFFSQVCADIEAVSYANTKVPDETLEKHCRLFNPSSPPFIR